MGLATGVVWIKYTWSLLVDLYPLLHLSLLIRFLAVKERLTCQWCTRIPEEVKIKLLG